MAGTTAMPPQEIASDATDVRKEMSSAVSPGMDVQDLREVSADDDEFQSEDEDESFEDVDEELKEVREVDATTDIEKMDATDLLALSKSRLKESMEELALAKSRLKESMEEKEVVKGSAVTGDNDDNKSPRVETDNMFELAIAKGNLAESLAETDLNLLVLAEKKVKEAQAKANVDEAMPPKPARSENSELWALLNHSKMRLETGKHEMGSKKSSRNSIRGDDAMSVTSKVSKSSKKSNEAPITVVGGPDEVGDAPLHDVNGIGYASTGGSVSSASEMKNDDEIDNNSDDDDDNGDEESSEEEEEEELPSFLKDNDEEQVDPEEAKALYEAAKFKAASILSVTKDNLSDVQMLQAIAIAEEAAKKGDDKFSTKRSLFKLNEAKVEDLKALLNFSTRTPEEEEAYQKSVAREAVGWGIGKGRLIKKLGSVVQDFKIKCAEIDQKNQRERIETGQPTIQDVTSAAMIDLKAQIEEMEKIVSKTGSALMDSVKISDPPSSTSPSTNGKLA
jgi:hypothetical protein